MEAFDSIGQIINVELLVNKGKKIDFVNIHKMTTAFNQQTYSTAFPKMINKDKGENAC